MQIIKKRKGFTLTEVLLVLSLAALIIITTLMMYPKVSANMRASKEAHNITIIGAGVKVLYSSTPYYTGLTTDVAVKGNVFPDSILEGSSNTPVNAWKGTISLTPGNDGPSGATDSSFSITDPNIPALECIHLATELSSNFYQIKINGTTVKSASIVYDPAVVTQACSSANNNTLIFISY